MDAKVPDVKVEAPTDPVPTKEGSDPKVEKTEDASTEANKTNKTSSKEGAKEEEKPVERTKIVRVDQIWDKKTRKFRYVKTAKPKNKKEKFARYVVTVARRISVQGIFTGQYQVDIRGKYISAILSEIYRNVEGVSFPETISMDQEELKLLFHARLELLAALTVAKAAEDPNEDMIFELEAVLEFINEHFGHVLMSMADLPQFHVSFQHIWTLFKPNTLVYGSDNLRQGRVFRVHSSKYGQREDGSAYYSLTVDFLDSNGESTGYVYNEGRAINGFEGSMPVFKLPYFPIQLHPDYKNLRQTLIERGNKWISLQGRHLQEYKGLAVDLAGKKFNSHGRVMLDPVILQQVQPNNNLVPYIETPIRHEDLTDDQKMLLNPVLYGFSLGDKIWGAFAISQLEKVEWNDSIIESLVLDPQRKEFIRALVRTHGLKEDTESFDDFVRDKGKGLIGLLAGPPGVGKTLTAEAVAEIAHRPLYMISSGELGESSSSVQSSLASVLELAEAWKAVVLLDEADVFLAKRDNLNLHRNAVTSIFLRHLEYYQGILLLTTNRLTSFDPAFQSRIHFCFEYENLTFTARLSIWEKFLQKAKSTPNLEVTVDESALRQLAELDLNGRQIKNCMSIAQAVSSEKKQPLSLDIVRLAVGFANIAWKADDSSSDSDSASSLIAL